jgi:hypothetical protein
MEMGIIMGTRQKAGFAFITYYYYFTPPIGTVASRHVEGDVG